MFDTAALGTRELLPLLAFPHPRVGLRRAATLGTAAARRAGRPRSPRGTRYGAAMTVAVRRDEDVAEFASL
ncbi:MAG: hypothetical protein ACXVHJ_25210 [Solirubrobacteraceae bacterium]